MEECDALCSRLAIMVDGSFRCIGTQRHLKNKFGKGYSLKFKTPNEEPATIKRLMDFMKATFVDCTLVDDYHGQLVYNLPARSIDWSRLFAKLEKAKSKDIIEDYSLSETTLEEIYIDITRDSNVLDAPFSDEKVTEAS